MVRTGIAWLAVALLAALPAVARAQAAKSDSVVKITATADKPDADGKQTVTINLAIDKPFHIYANPIGQEVLASFQTVVEIASKTKLADVKIDYPQGKVKVDKEVGNYNIYEDKVTIKAAVRRAKGDTGPLKVSVSLSSCSDEKGCLLPATVDVEVPPARTPNKPNSMVKITATADRPDSDGKQTVTINMAIDKPYHVYANPVGLKDLDVGQTVVAITSKTKLEDVKIAYPKGKQIVDNIVGNYNIYEGNVTITAEVRRAKGDTSPLLVSVAMQPMTDYTCHLPMTIDVEVP